MPKSERAALENVFEAQRIGLIRKVEGISDELARQAPTASSLSLLGLINHAATWEQRWFQVGMAGQQAPDGWPGTPATQTSSGKLSTGHAASEQHPAAAPGIGAVDFGHRHSRWDSGISTVRV